MATANTWWFNEALKEIGQGDIDLDNDTFIAMLVSEAGTFARTPTTVTGFLAQSSVTECALSGYARVTLSGLLVDNSTNVTRWKANHPDFGSIAAGGNWGHVMIFKRVGGSPDPAVDIPVIQVGIAPKAADGNPFGFQFGSPSGGAGIIGTFTAS